MRVDQRVLWIQTRIEWGREGFIRQWMGMTGEASQNPYGGGFLTP